MSTWAIEGRVLSRPSGSNLRYCPPTVSPYMWFSPSTAWSMRHIILSAENSKPLPAISSMLYSTSRAPVVRARALRRSSMASIEAAQ